MASTDESETDQPFLITDVERSLNDKSIVSKWDIGRMRGVRWRRWFVYVSICVAMLCVGFGLGFLAARKLSKSEPVAMSEPANECSSGTPPLLLLSLDGFRSDYFNRGLTPHLLSLASSGVRAKFLQSQFPTKTFPNHYSIVTGLYPESHGIVHNSFYDPVLNDTFYIGGPSSHDSRWWNGGEPLWVTAHTQGLKTATYFWPGSDVKIRNVWPDYWFLYNSSVPWTDRVDTVLGWLDLPDDERPSFMTLYVEEPDHTGHVSGPQSKEVDDALATVDSVVIQSLVNGLKDRGLYDCVNIIVVSDHGMTEVNTDRIVFADECFPSNQALFQASGPVSLVEPAPGASLQTLLNDSSHQCLGQRAHFYLKEDLPKRFHYSNNKRISPAVIMADLGWRVLPRDLLSDWQKEERGAHGYDNLEPMMEALFIARGPAFKEGLIVEGFPNIELYNLMADLLGIVPAPNNGTSGSLNHLLKRPHEVSGSGVSQQLCECNTVPFLAFNYSSGHGGHVCPYPQVSLNDLTNIDSLLSLSSLSEEQLLTIHVPWGVPQRQGINGCDTVCVLSQPSYVTGYDRELHIPLWVSYRLDGKKLSSSIGRKNSFRQDPRLPSSDSATCGDYSHSGLDRGHLAPSGDMNYNYTTMAQTFYLSNVAPQYHSFNAGIWLYAEELTRLLAKFYGTIYVISGSIFDVNNDGIADDRYQSKSWLHNLTGSAAIPTDFFKIIVRCDGGQFSISQPEDSHNISSPLCSGQLRTMSFVLPHSSERIYEDSSNYLLNNVASIRDIRLLSGFDFFPHLSHDEKASLQSVVPMSVWSIS